MNIAAERRVVAYPVATQLDEGRIFAPCYNSDSRIKGRGGVKARVESPLTERAERIYRIAAERVSKP